MNDVLLDVYKKELEKYKREHFIYKMRLGKYEDLNIPPTDEEKYEEMMKETFKKAEEQEQIKKNSDNERVDFFIKRLTKPILNPYLEGIIKHFETIIDKIEEKQKENIISDEDKEIQKNMLNQLMKK